MKAEQSSKSTGKIVAPPHGDAPNDAFPVVKEDEERVPPAIARALLAPDARHSAVIQHLLSAHFGKIVSEVGMGDFSEAMRNRENEAEKGELDFVSRTLAAQASTLDVIFGEMARRMAINAAEYPRAMERYGRLALKAQASSRATMEALIKLHQPREQTVRHVHVSEGGQAVVADQFHHHAGRSGNAKSAKQPHATGTATTCGGPPLPCPDPFGEAVPIASREGEAAL